MAGSEENRTEITQDLETQQALRSYKRRNGIKNVVIVFLIIMLVLTFFSNTIMNYTLPQVATQYVEAGEISPKVRGAGTAVIEDPYNVNIAAGRKIAAVEVHSGDQVHKDDVLFRLEDTESDDLINARKALESAESSFQKALFSGTFKDSAINRIKKGDFLSEKEMQAQVSEVTGAYEKALQESNSAAAEVAKYQATGGKNLSNAESRKARADAALSKATSERDAVVSSIQAEIDIKALYDAVQDAKKKVETLEKEEKKAEVTAPIDGTVTNVAYQAGDTVSADAPAAVIRREGNAMTVSFTVTKEQAQGLRTGDEARPQNAWAYSEFSAKLLSISADPTDPGKSKVLKFEINCPEIEAGEQVSLSVGQTSKEYDLVVPNSAIREDNNGKFILIVNSKASPLGNRYTASRVDVQVLARDEKMSAVSGNLAGYEYVITTSTRPVSPGMQVRLADDAE